MTTVPARRATLNMAKNSSKVSLFMRCNSVETSLGQRLVKPCRRRAE
jgi:hypothetical protein